MSRNYEYLKLYYISKLFYNVHYDALFSNNCHAFDELVVLQTAYEQLLLSFRNTGVYICISLLFIVILTLVVQNGFDETVSFCSGSMFTDRKTEFRKFIFYLVITNKSQTTSCTFFSLQ